MLVLFALAAIAAETHVDPASLPAPIQSSIQAKFPGATVAGATKEPAHGADNYEASIKYQNRAIDLAFAADGSIVEEEEVVALTDAPAPVQATLSTKFAGWTVGRVERSITPKATVWEAIVKKGEKAEEVAIDATGAVKSTEKADDDD